LLVFYVELPLEAVYHDKEAVRVVWCGERGEERDGWREEGGRMEGGEGPID
jgi:hypothetical protein